MAIEAVRDIQKASNSAFSGTVQQVFIQDTQPADTGQPYIWIQTNLPGGNVTVWYNATGTS